MADLRVNIIATDKATPSINKVGQAVSGLAQQFGGLSGGIGKLANQLGGIIGAGGMAGMAVGAAALAANLEDLKHEFADWATGMDKAGEGLDKLDSKTEAYIKTLKGLQNQLELVNLAGVARTAAEFGQRQREVAHLERQIEERRAAIVRLEALRQEQAKGFGLPGVGYITPGLKATEESLKRANEELADLSKQLGIARTEGALAAATLNKDLAEEGKKRFGELTREAEKFAAKVEQIDRMLSVQFERPRGEIPAPPLPILGPSILSPEQIQKMKEDMTEGLEDLSREGLQISKKRTDQELDYYFDQGLKVQNKIENMRQDAFREQQRQYERMIDGIREGAGRVFDAMLTKGESVFASLAKFAEGVLQTAMRNVFQNAVQSLALRTGTAGLFGGGGGGAGALAGAAGSSGLGAIFGGLFGGGGAAAATGGMGPMLGATAAAETTAAGGGILGGLFGGGAAGAVGLGGTLAAGAATAGIATAAILATSFISGLFKGGEERRAEERARRAGIIQGQQFMGPETINRFGIAGGAGYAVETDLTGSIRGIGKTPTVIVNVENNMIDARHAREAGAVIGQEVSRQLLQGGSLLADNVAWASS